MRFWLGVHMPNWLATAGVPLMVSHRRLKKCQTLPKAIAPWVLDSGGFTELQINGQWLTTTSEYLEAIQRYQEGIGLMAWAAPQDWMCEPFMLDKTGLSVAAHQDLTLTNYLELREAAPGVPIIPVLQGWELEDYERHADAYQEAGVDLLACPVVGVGSVCRRQKQREAADIIRALAQRGLQLHGFGFKVTAIKACQDILASADSMAWSFDARRKGPLPGCPHKRCNNCQRFALRWAAYIERLIGQPTLWDVTPTDETAPL